MTFTFLFTFALLTEVQIYSTVFVLVSAPNLLPLHESIEVLYFPFSCFPYECIMYHQHRSHTKRTPLLKCSIQFTQKFSLFNPSTPKGVLIISQESASTSYNNVNVWQGSVVGKVYRIHRLMGNIGKCGSNVPVDLKF